MLKNAKDLEKWDVIRFRRSNARRWSTGLLLGDVEIRNFAGFESIIAEVEVGKNRELLAFSESLEWEFVATFKPAEVSL